MILRVLKVLFVYFSTPKQEPVRLAKKQEPHYLEGLNWTFIALALCMVLFFAMIWIFQVGNPYPNDLMNGSLDI